MASFGFIPNSICMCSANGVLLNLWLLVSWLLLHNLFHMLYGICNSYSIKSLYFSGFSMTLLLSRESEPIWFAGMSSQQKTSLNKGICLVPAPYSCAWVPASWGSAAARLPAAQALSWSSTLHIWLVSLALGKETSHSCFTASNETQGFKNWPPPLKKKKVPPEKYGEFV